MTKALVAVDSKNWQKLVGTTSPFLLIVHRGQDLSTTIIDCIKAMQLQSASISGLGALEDPTVAYFNMETKQYEDATLPGLYELISINGNVGHDLDNNYIGHFHVALGDKSHNVKGGHLKKAKVGITAEITIIPFAGTFIRKTEPSMNVKLIEV